MDTQPQQQPAKIHAAICKIMQEIGGVEKSRKNQQQGYSFRGIADVYLACQPVMAKHGVHVAPVEIREQTMTVGKSSTGKDSYHFTMRVLFKAFADDGSWVPVETIGEAIDSSDKAANKAMSQAMKYCLVQLFALPEEDPESDTDNASPEMTTGAAGKAKAEAPQDKSNTGKKPGPIGSLLALLAKSGKEKPADVLAWMSQRLNRQIKATKELTPSDIAQLTQDADALTKEAA